jgi:glycosyltransferase involved in cell wall biosynthesis
MQSSKYNILYLSPGSWYQEFHRKPLVIEISKHPEVNKIYVLEPPADLFHAPLKNWKRLRHGLKSLISTSQEAENIFVYTPFVFIHPLVAYKNIILRYLNLFIFKINMRRLLKRDKINKNIIFSVFRPEMIDFIDFYDDMICIYDCYDEYLLTSQDKNIKNLDRLEAKLMKRSDFIFTTSQKLYEKAQRFNINSFLLHNAADTNLFGRAYLDNVEKPHDIQNLKPPIIGYVGALRDWQDFELLEYLFVNNPDMNFVFIGHNRKSAIRKGKDFDQYVNVHFLGQKRFEDVPAYIKYLDIAIIPNRMTKFNQNVVPYKLFEYMAAGKKILSTNHSPDLQMFFKDYIKTAKNKIEFSEKLKELVYDNTIDLHKTFAFGQKQSWKNRVEKMFSIISSNQK